MISATKLITTNHLKLTLTLKNAEFVQKYIYEYVVFYTKAYHYVPVLTIKVFRLSNQRKLLQLRTPKKLENENESEKCNNLTHHARKYKYVAQ